MKKIVCFLLAISLMLSLSVFSFAESVPPIEQTPFYVDMEYIEYDGIVPYSLAPVTDYLFYNTTYGSGTFGQLPYPASVPFEDGLATGSCRNSFIGLFGSSNQYLSFGRQSTTTTTPNTYYWVNFIGKLVDSDGLVITPEFFNGTHEMILAFNSTSSFTNTGGQAVGQAFPIQGGNYYLFDDGYFQVALVGKTSVQFGSAVLHLGGINQNFTVPVNFEVETLDFYVGEASDIVPPFTFGSGAHGGTVDPPAPKDPNDHTQYGSASDQVEWYNDAYGAAVNPDLEDKMSATTDMLLQEQEIEEQMIDGINQYAPAVNPANLTMPTQIVNGLRFVGDTFMGSYNALGDIGFVISFSMMLGVVLVLIGRGEGALARGMAASSRAERNRIAEEKRVMYERRRYGQERNR